jgi:hypothetical protein
MKINKIRKTAVAITVLFFCLDIANLYGIDENGEIPEIVEDKVINIKLPTEFGAQAEIFHSFFGDEKNWYIGPGLFFDYKMNKDVTLSANAFVSFQSFGSSNEQSIIVKPGLFVKHWLSNEWGYIGAGLEGVFYSGIDGDYFQLMLSAIITGENVKVKKNINTIGDLKLSLSLFDTGDSNEVRFNITYSLGIAFEVSVLRSDNDPNNPEVSAAP